MSTNLSKEKREKLVEKIKAIKTYIATAEQDENTARLLTYIAEIEKDIKGKKYGLVFEEHRESIDEMLENNLPVLVEDESLFIDNGGQMNFLIEGDNLASLKLLEKTHKGKIDLIYIDPPYNTGAKNWKYNNDYVDSNDLYRHSKWLSMRVTEKQVREFYKEALKSEPLLLINYYVKEIILRDDEITIIFNSPLTTNSPDESQGFSFYDKIVSIPVIVNYAQYPIIGKIRLIMSV